MPRNGPRARTTSAPTRRPARSTSNGPQPSWKIILTSLSRWLSIWAWTYLTWILLTWSKAPEQLSFGAAAAAVVATLLAPLGPVLAPWALLSPRRFAGLVRTARYVAVSMIGANISLSRRIWSRSRPLRPGMVVVPTEMKTEGELTAVEVLTSLIVDNQIIDLDRKRNELQYHGVWLETGDPALNRSQINGPLEDLLRDLRKP